MTKIQGRFKVITLQEDKASRRQRFRKEKLQKDKAS
jgi:hypothetical protein